MQFTFEFFSFRRDSPPNVYSLMCYTIFPIPPLVVYHLCLKYDKRDHIDALFRISVASVIVLLFGGLKFLISSVFVDSDDISVQDEGQEGRPVSSSTEDVNHDDNQHSELNPLSLTDEEVCENNDIESV